VEQGAKRTDVLLQLVRAIDVETIFWLMIVKRLGAVTFWAQSSYLFGVIQIDVDFAFFQLQFHALDFQRSLDSRRVRRSVVGSGFAAVPAFPAPA